LREGRCSEYGKDKKGEIANERGKDEGNGKGKGERKYLFSDQHRDGPLPSKP
jgi:hypothetical protein